MIGREGGLGFALSHTSLPQTFAFLGHTQLKKLLPHQIAHGLRTLFKLPRYLEGFLGRIVEQPAQKPTSLD
jgi:hypothetical protein